jgi:hypothetical protein
MICPHQPMLDELQRRNFSPSTNLGIASSFFARLPKNIWGRQEVATGSGKRNGGVRIEWLDYMFGPQRNPGARGGRG